MAWARFDDHFDEHPKVVEAGAVAESLHVNAICWCNRNRTDGFVPKAQVARLIALDGFGIDPRVTHDDLIERLLEVGMWELDGNGYRVHDYGDFQPTGTDRAALSAKRAAAGRAGAAARWKRDTPAETNGHVDPDPEVIAIVQRVARTLHDEERFTHADCEPALQELRRRLLAGDTISSPVQLAASIAEKNRREREKRTRHAAEEKARRELANGTDECEHGNVRRDCPECKAAADVAAAAAMRRLRGEG